MKIRKMKVVLLFWITLFSGISCIKAENDFNKSPRLEDSLNEQKSRIEVPRQMNRTGWKTSPFFRFRSVSLNSNPALEPPKLPNLRQPIQSVPPKFLGANSFNVPNWLPNVRPPNPPISKDLLNSKFQMPTFKINKPVARVASKGSKFFKYMAKILGGGFLVGGGIFACHSISKKDKGSEESEETIATAPPLDEPPPPYTPLSVDVPCPEQPDPCPSQSGQNLEQQDPCTQQSQLTSPPYVK